MIASHGFRLLCDFNSRDGLLNSSESFLGRYPASVEQTSRITELSYVDDERLLRRVPAASPRQALGSRAWLSLLVAICLTPTCFPIHHSEQWIESMRSDGETVVPQLAGALFPTRRPNDRLWHSPAVRTVGEHFRC
jgi:hypothetical protein